MSLPEYKDRLKLLAFILISLLFIVGVSFLGYTSIKEILLNKSDVIILTRGTIISLFSPVIVAPIFVLAGYLLFTGKQAPLVVQKKTVALFLIFIAGGFIAEIAFSIYYTNKLDEEGFQRCRGIPIGTLPGTAVKYAKSEELCKQKRKY